MKLNNYVVKFFIDLSKLLILRVNHMILLVLIDITNNAIIKMKLIDMSYESFSSDQFATQKEINLTNINASTDLQSSRTSQQILKDIEQICRF